MTSGESFEKSVIEVDGVQFETLMPRAHVQYSSGTTQPRWQYGYPCAVGYLHYQQHTYAVSFQFLWQINSRTYGCGQSITTQHFPSHKTPKT